MIIKTQIIFSFDTETVGLYGKPFAISYVIFNYNGEELESGYISCPIENAKGEPSNRKWILKNVVPHLPKNTNCNTPQELCEMFYDVWMRCKEKYK
jgi:hypothetical protein